MDPERTYLRMHARLSGMLSQLLTPRARMAVEHASLAVAFALLGLLIFMHANFVQQPGCSSELSEISNNEAQLVQIKITGIGLWTQRPIKEDIEDSGEKTWSESSIIPEMDGGGFMASPMNFWSGWSAFLDAMKRIPLKSFRVRKLDNESKAFEPAYLYTVEKGYFLLPEEARARHNIQTINITISAQKSCFGNRWQQLLINCIVGYDTILINSLLSFPGHGYLYNFQTKDFYDLNHGQDLSVPARFGDYLVTKCGVLVMSLFVFFTTTMSVSFTLRETQDRMLKFTVQLQHHARNQLPTFQLIFVHVVESLVFVPIVIGILFFLFEFYDDQLLAFLVLFLIWLCELFTMISVRTAMSMQFFPRFILLYFLVFHLYFFSYPYGFSYLAFSTTASFVLHLVLYFWNRFEVPALQRFTRLQVHLQQQMGFPLMPSAFYTSPLHLARLNANIVYNGTMLRSDRGFDPLDSRAGEASDFNSQQTGTAPVSSVLNPFGSFLFWLLGGAPSVGLISFFSIFRDTRAQGHVSEEQVQGGT